MKRRIFIARSIGAAIIAGFNVLFPKKIFGAISKSGNYDLVAVKGGEADAMFDKAIAAMGGMEKYVKPGQDVVVKPNIGWDKTVEEGANTNPQLIKRIVEHCFEAGAKNVYVLDHTCNNWKKTYDNSGIEDAVKSTSAKMVTGNNESHYREVTNNSTQKIKSAKIHSLILDSDVFINVPVLKHHHASELTIAMKNLMGIVWDRGFWHRNDLHRCIAEFPHYIKPDLNVIDAYRVMKRNGPIGKSVDDIVVKKSLLVSEDIVTADAAAAKIFGIEPEQVNYINIADQIGIGKKDLNTLNIKRIKV